MARSTSTIAFAVEAFKFHLNTVNTVCFNFLFLPRKHQQIIKLQPITRNEQKYARIACATMFFPTLFVCISFSWSAMARILFTNFIGLHWIRRTVRHFARIFLLLLLYSFLMVFKWPNRTFEYFFRLIAMFAFKPTIFGFCCNSHLKNVLNDSVFLCVYERKKNERNRKNGNKWHLEVSATPKHQTILDSFFLAL